MCHVATPHSDLIMLTVKITGDLVSYGGVFLSQCSSQNHMVEAMKCKYPFHTATRQSTLFCVQLNSSQDFINGLFSPQCS